MDLYVDKFAQIKYQDYISFLKRRKYKIIFDEIQ